MSDVVKNQNSVTNGAKAKGRIMKLTITTLIENHSDEERHLASEHGLSLFIEVDDYKILFDTGQSGAFLANADKLNIDLSTVQDVVISHGHYDHSGGFESLINAVGMVPKLIVGEGFFIPKYKKLSDDQYKFNGNLFDAEYIKKKQIPLRIVTEDITYLRDEIFLFKNFEQRTGFEQLNPNFYKEHNGRYLQDDFMDELVLGIITDKGLVLIVGCSHVGIINILKTIKKRIHLPIFAVIGGTHLVDADEERIRHTIDSFKEMDIRLVAVSHCTGEEGSKTIQKELKDCYIFNHTGNRIII
ncbi:MBL fold metallo-hydrolase [Mobilitalea sibirica]|uniref:MBL fold metallo-hydrolase n=1 Tax=Mobilitalea sibirica TaxID=1462919 RepID=A0A8J7KUV6_9FIRM|nr:MBL fold metallo-hydrolase [Mobilitalea sibirica]MBH1939430.1 MBL fold metallo-hydrolase [Mobilitalea sibirica]